MKFLRFLAHTLLTHKALALLPAMFTSIGSFFVVGIAVFGLVRAALIIA